MEFLKKIGTPLLIGAALGILPILYFVSTGASWQPLAPHEHLVQNAIAYVFLILFTYYNHTVFVPRWFLNKQYRRYILITICCILGAVYLPYRIEQWVFFQSPQENTIGAWARQIFVAEMMFGDSNGKPLNMRENKSRMPGGPPDFFSDYPSKKPFRPQGPPGGGRPRGEPPTMSWILPSKLAIFFLIGSVSSLISILIQATNRLHKVENDQLQAELRQLKAQIQPHFLFNTLNSIYALAIRNDERTADTIVQLSEFLRYIIRDANREHVALVTELNYIHNYIGLQKARLRDAVKVNYRLDGDTNGLQIAPLILFSFIENAFKYGVNPEEDSPIDIHIKMDESGLQLLVANNKVQVNEMEASTGIGLANTKERLRLIYPAAHELAIDDTGRQFRVTLNLTLT
ncbi:sensor histidine kinase [Dyadobacter flavalbus]|uniref:Sensor histidine kinase n=1 Tax=Dyadobacter flavalbus TaxID=2579942 RepID=A0A5M8QUP7_9BACT|nr:histidine kinase [Dyadobacter flavalbus]KAA6438554.1 sensor histidine kinase [Dyadobacter flavalbus]